MKPDESALLDALLALHERQAFRIGVEFADAVGDRLGLHPKRTYYLLCKWTDRGWWEYGVSARSGWFTPEGIAASRPVEDIRARGGA